MKARRYTLTTLISLILFAAGVQGAEPVSEGIGDEFRDTLLRLAQSGELPGDGAPLVIERPAERVSDFGLLVDRDHQDGLLVLGTLPGGSAERIGLRAGDRLLSANGIDLRGAGGSGRMRELLDDPDSDGGMDLQLRRGSHEQRLAGTVETVVLPAMRIELSSSSTSAAIDHRVAGDPESRCGRLSTLPVAPKTRNLFPVRLIAVDGELPGTSSQDSFRLPPGRRVLTVAELIDPEYFSGVANMQRGRRGRDAYKTLEVDVQPGVTYLLAARFHRDRENRILDGGYWQPVVWKERAERCR